MRYKCLVLDHDDTVVDSTATIHFPCFVQYLSETRPALRDRYTLQDYLCWNFDPGVVAFFREEVGMSEAEFAAEQQYWSAYVEGHIPTAYAGMGELMRAFRAAGGLLAVDSHSYARYIMRDYEHNGLPTPDIIYGWELPDEQRKPSPYTLYDLMRRYELRPEELLVVDDLKPGYDMARAAGVPFAAAGWAYRVPQIESFMRAHCDIYCESVGALAAHLGLA